MQLIPPQAPTLVNPAPQYDQGQEAAMASAMRQYFNKLNALFKQLVYGFNNYGSFYDMTQHTIAAANTAYTVTLSAAGENFGVALSSPTSRVQVTQKGVYKVHVGLQLDKSTAGTGTTWAWLRKNGTDLPNTARRWLINGTTDQKVGVLEALLTLNGGDYLEVVWAADNTGALLNTYAAVAPVPAVPSAFVQVQYVYPNTAV